MGYGYVDTNKIKVYNYYAKKGGNKMNIGGTEIF